VGISRYPGTKKIGTKKAVSNHRLFLFFKSNCSGHFLSADYAEFAEQSKPEIRFQNLRPSAKSADRRLFL
jgi:hypothetical protein